MGEHCALLWGFKPHPDLQVQYRGDGEKVASFLQLWAPSPPPAPVGSFWCFSSVSSLPKALSTPYLDSLILYMAPQFLRSSFVNRTLRGWLTLSKIEPAGRGCYLLYSEECPSHSCPSDTTFCRILGNTGLGARVQIVCARAQEHFGETGISQIRDFAIHLAFCFTILKGESKKHAVLTFLDCLRFENYSTTSRYLLFGHIYLRKLGYNKHMS